MDIDKANPAEQLIGERVKLITDEIGESLANMDFTDPADWRKAFDIAERFARWSILADVIAGNWAAAGIDNLNQLADLKVTCERCNEGVHISIIMPTVMRIMRSKDDPNVN